MPVIWEKRQGGDVYQVRTAGETRRLYRNGVLHTELHPQRRVTGSVWDLLLLPAFFVEPGALKRVLLLGVGGGAVIQQLRHFLAPEEIVGIELSSLHIEVAERFFGVKGKGIRLVQGDGVAWARDYQGPRFDLVIDDLFTEEGREPVRVVPADPRWCRTLERLVSREGVLAMNFPDSGGLKNSCIVEGSAPGFGSAFRLKTPNCENAVGVFSRRERTPRYLRERLREHPDLDTRKFRARLKYAIRTLA